MNGEKSELIYIGETIYKLRKSRKMSQKELAEKADISEVNLSRIENGVVCMNILTLVKIAKALSVTEGEIFEFK
ncbi:MAG: helix-turn-helix transcriptional regulator [Eubacteriales bacterium]|nr:helix-turn-helix transcriptional regulator [Eubacteriales bacterium]